MRMKPQKSKLFMNGCGYVNAEQWDNEGTFKIPPLKF